MTRTIIKTGVYTMLRGVAERTAAGAGLALLRGPVGIGKSFALDMLERDAPGMGIEMVRVTVTPSIDGNVNAFFKAILGPYASAPGSCADAADAAWQVLHGYPFRSSGKRVLLVTDESQGLTARILEATRGLYNMGDAARQGDENAPAFGCMMVGNSTFMTRGGSVRKANFGPLLDRVSENLTLPTPSKAECAQFAAMIFPDDADMQSALAGAGQVRRNFRAMDIAARQAGVLAKGEKITMAHLRAALNLMGVE
jgi:hypothetical protein